jgi:hypothetical protein
VTLAQNFVGATKGGSWSFGGPLGAQNVAHVFRNSLANILEVCKRLQRVQIENAPALNIMRQWEKPCYLLLP